MGASKKIKKRLIDLGITQLKFAEMLGKPEGTVRNTLVKDNMTISILEEYANALGCDVVLIDRETGEIYR